MRIDKFIVLSRGAENNGERAEEANLANAVEAVIAAIYFDGGMDKAKEFIINNWNPFMADESLFEDPKTTLQQICQEQYKVLPAYELVESKGPDHAPIFKTKVTVGKFFAFGLGKNKKTAEQEAAKNLIEILPPQWIKIKNK